MANKTVVFTNYFLNGTSGLTLLLLDPETAAIGNGAGDTLTAGSNGLFSAVVTEAITGWWNIVVLQGAVVVLEGGKVYFPSDTLGTYQVDDANSPTTVGTINPNTITSSALASSAVDEIVDAVYDEPMSGHTVNGSYGSHLVRSANQNQNTVQITGSQHIAADIHEFQPGVITSGDFAAGAITSTVLATDSITSSQIAASAVTEIQAGLATSSGVASAFTEIKGATWSSSTDTLEAIRDASGAATINVTPLQAVVNQLVNGTRVETFIGFTGTVGPITVTDTNNNPVNLSAPCEIIISKKWRGDILVIPDGSITRSGASNNQFSFSASGATLIPGEHAWALRRLSDNYVFAYGDWIVKQAAKKD